MASVGLGERFVFNRKGAFVERDGVRVPMADGMRVSKPCSNCGETAPDPAVWGPPMWREFHARMYRRDLSGEEQWIRQDFGPRIPCPECRAHFLAVMDVHRIDLRGPMKYGLWQVERHNDVRKRLGQPPFMARKLILRNTQSPGDLVMLTAAVRDLHSAHPGQFYTNVITSCPDLWEHNPHIVPVQENEGEPIQCDYPLVHDCNKVGMHFIHGFRLDLEKKLGVSIPPGECKGDIHLSHEELSWMSQVEQIRGIGARFWIVNAGIKSDFTCKLWDKYQGVIDHFRGKIEFVQVGSNEHIHPALDGVLDLRGKTTMRELIRLVHHADGVLCGVTALMHLAAAVPVRNGRPASRPCVVVAGGREPQSWEAYNTHRFIQNVGTLDCCRTGGCWKSRVVALNDGAEQDKSLCAQPVEVRTGTFVPRCMDRISAAQVCEAIESYLT